jgi:hypothetical protein
VIIGVPILSLVGQYVLRAHITVKSSYAQRVHTPKTVLDPRIGVVGLKKDFDRDHMLLDELEASKAALEMYYLNF